MLGKILSIGTIVAAVSLVLLLNLTTPAQAGPIGILGFFILAYIAVIGLVAFGLHGASRLIAKFSSSLTVKKPIAALSLRRCYYYASFIALAPVMLIGLQSVGGIGPYDVILIGTFVLIGCIYISRRIS